MNVSNANAPFGQNNLIFGSGPNMDNLRKKHASLDDAFTRVKNAVAAAQTQRASEDRFTAMHAEFDAFQERVDEALDEATGLEDVPEDVLWAYRNHFAVGMSMGRNFGEMLTTFRDGLSALDGTIADYQKMLSGEADLPSHMSREAVGKVLDAARLARERYVQDGVKQLNGFGIGYFDFTRRVANRISMESKFENVSEAEWKFDAGSDVYAELDRLSNMARDYVKENHQGYSLVNRELERRLGDRYKLFFAASREEEPSVSPAVANQLDGAAYARAYLRGALKELERAEDE